MSSNLGSARPRLQVGKLKRLAVSAVAVTVGAIVLSGCVVIQSESAIQGNVIGNTVTVTTNVCASQAAAAAPCNTGGNTSAKQLGPNTSAQGQLLVGYRIPAGVAAPATITTTAPTTAPDGSATTATLTLTQSPSYTAGLNAIAPPPGGTQWVGYISEKETYFANGQQTISFAPTFGLPAGFSGQFTWRTVVGYRSAIFTGDVQCPNGFPGAQASLIPGQGSVCIDNPDLATIQGPPSAMQIGDLAIQAPATPTIPAGSSVALNFTGLFTGGNPSGGVFAVAASTTIPGVTPTVTPTFAPAANSSNALPVSFAVPASTPVGTYDVTVSATIAGITRSGVGHITVKEPVKSTASAKTNAAKLSASVKTTTLKVARKTGIPLTFTLSKASAISLVALQTKPKVSVTVRKTLKAGKKTVVLIKSARLHKGKVTITFKGGGVTRIITTTLR
jgi:hypothetical protein